MRLFRETFSVLRDGSLQAGAFTQVVDYFRCVPGDILFLDDTLANVEAARRSGLSARQAKGIADLRMVLDVD